MKGLGKKKDADSHAAPISVPQMHTLPVPAMITYGELESTGSSISVKVGGGKGAAEVGLVATWGSGVDG